MSTSIFYGHYYDGRFSGRIAAVLQSVDQEVMLSIQSEQFPLSQCTTSEIYKNGKFLVYLNDSAYCEFHDKDLSYFLKQHQASIPSFSTPQSNKTIVTAVIFLFLLIAGIYYWLIPTISGIAARYAPESMQQQLGNAVLAHLDATMLAPSELTPKQQYLIYSTFAEINKHDYHLEFRKIRDNEDTLQSANAFALPGGIIIITDEMAQLLEFNVHAIRGVLAHEIGHLLQRHHIQRTFSRSGLSILFATITGGVSTSITTAPWELSDSYYSRVSEAEADTMAKQILCQNGHSPVAFAIFFKKLQERGQERNNIFLSTHPYNHEREQFFLDGCI